MSTIEITRVEDVRAGDVVTLSYYGHEFTGKAWNDPNNDGLNVGSCAIKWYRYPEREFVRATRDLPDLPTEPGSVIVASGDDYGHPFANVPLMRDHTGVWFGYGPTGNPITVSGPDVFTAWTPARIVPEDGAS